MAREYRIDVVVDAAQAVEGGRQFTGVMEELAASADDASKKLDRYISKQNQFARQLDDSAGSVFSFKDVAEQLQDTLRAGAKLVDVYGTEVASLAVQFRDAAGAGSDFLAVLTEIRNSQPAIPKLPQQDGEPMSLKEVTVEAATIDTGQLKKTLKTEIDEAVAEATAKPVIAEVTVESGKIDYKAIKLEIEETTAQILKQDPPMQLLLDVGFDARQIDEQLFRDRQTAKLEQEFEASAKISAESLAQVNEQLDLQLNEVTADRPALPVEQEYLPTGVVGEDNLDAVTTELDSTLSGAVQFRPAIPIEQVFTAKGVLDSSALSGVTERVDSALTGVVQNRSALMVEQGYAVTGSVDSSGLAVITPQIDEAASSVVTDRPSLPVEQVYAPTGVIDDSGVEQVDSQLTTSLSGAVKDRDTITVTQEYAPLGEVNDAGVAQVDEDVQRTLTEAVKERPEIPITQVYAPTGVVDDSGVEGVTEEVDSSLKGAVEERPAIPIEQVYAPRGIVDDQGLAAVDQEVDKSLQEAVQDRPTIPITQIYAPTGVVDDDGLTRLEDDLDSSLAVEDRPALPVEQVYAPKATVDAAGLGDVEQDLDEALAVSDRPALDVEQTYLPTGTVDESRITQIDADVDESLKEAVSERSAIDIEQVYAPLGTVDPGGLARVGEDVEDSFEGLVKDRPTIEITQLYAPQGMVDDDGLTRVGADIDQSLNEVVQERPAIPVEQVYAPRGTVDDAGLATVEQDLDEVLAVSDRPTLPIEQVYLPKGTVDDSGLDTVDADIDDSMTSVVKDRPAIPIEQTYAPLGTVDPGGLARVDADVDDAFEGVVREREAITVEQQYDPFGTVNEAALTDVEQDLDTALAIKDRPAIPVEQTYAPRGVVDAAGMAGLDEDLDQSLQVSDRPPLTVEQAYLPKATVEDAGLEQVETDLDNALAIPERAPLSVEQTYLPTATIDDSGLSEVKQDVDRAVESVSVERPTIEIEQVYVATGRVDDSELSTVRVTLLDAVRQPAEELPEIVFGATYVPEPTVVTEGLQTELVRPLTTAGIGLPSIPVTITYEPETIVATEEVQPALTEALQKEATLPTLPVEATFAATATVDTTGVKEAIQAPLEVVAEGLPAVVAQVTYAPEGVVDPSGLATVKDEVKTQLTEAVEGETDIPVKATYRPEGEVDPSGLSEVRTVISGALASAGMGYPDQVVTVTYTPDATLTGTEQVTAVLDEGLAPLGEAREMDVPVLLHPGAEIPPANLLDMKQDLTEVLEEVPNGLPPTTFEAAFDPLILVAPLPKEKFVGPLQEAVEDAGPVGPVEVPVPIDVSPTGLEDAGRTITDAVEKTVVTIEDGFSGASVSVEEFLETLIRAGGTTNQFAEMLRQDMVKVIDAMAEGEVTAERLKEAMDQLLTGRVSNELKELDAVLKQLTKDGEITKEQIAAITKVIDDMIEASSGAGNVQLVELLKGVRIETMQTIDSLKLLAESEEDAAARIKLMIQASFERIAAQKAELDAQANLIASSAEYNAALNDQTTSIDRMGDSYDEFTSRQALLQDMIEGEAQSLDDIIERRAELQEQFDDGLVPLSEYIELTKIIDKQEQEVIKVTEERTAALEQLQRRLDPVGAALRALADDEKQWEEALKSGAIQQDVYARGLENIAKKAEDLKGKLPPPGGHPPGGGPGGGGPGGGGPPLTPITVMGELGGAFAGAVGVGFGIGALKEAIEAASEYEVLLTKVKTSTHATDEETAKFREGIEDLSEAFINSNIEEANAALQILASGYHDTADAVRILAAANELADITFGDLARTADTLASVMSAFELKAGDSVTAMQTLAVASHGSTEELQSLATFAGRMGAEFKGAGLSLEDFAAAAATLKEAGGETRRVLAGMQQLIQKLASTTPEVAGRFKEWGIEVSRTRLENEGLLPILRDLMEATGGNEQILSHLLGSQQAAITVMKLMREEGTALADNYRNIANAAELAAQAAEDARATFHHQAEDLKSGLNNRMRELGEVIKDLLLPVLTRLNEHIDATFAALATAGALTSAIVSFKLLNRVMGGQLIPTLMAFPKAFQAAGIAMAATNTQIKAAATTTGIFTTASRIATVATTGLTTALRGLWLAFGPLGLLVTAATLLITMAANAKKAATDLATLRAETDSLADSIENMTRTQLAEQRATAETGLVKAQATLKELQEQQQDLKEQAGAPLSVTVGGGVTPDFTEQLDAVAAKLGVAERAVELYGDQIRMVDQHLDSSRRQVRGLRGDLEETTKATSSLTAADLTLGEQLADADPYLKTAKRIQEIVDLKAKLQSEIDTGLPEQVRTDQLAALNRELESLNVQSAQLATRKGEMQAYFESIVSKVSETAAALFAYKDRLRDINLVLSMTGVSQEQAADATELARLAYVGAANALNPLIQIAVKYSTEQINIAAAVREGSISQEMANEQLAVARMEYAAAGQSANKYREEVQKITDSLDPIAAAEREHIELLERVAALLGDEHPIYLEFKAKQEVLLNKTVALLKLEEDGLVALAAQYDPLIANELARTKALIEARAVVDALGLSEQERAEAMGQIAKVIDDHYNKLADTITQQAGLADVWRVAWEEAIKRIDTQFVDLWKSAFKSFDSFKESLKDSFKQMLAEIAHAAITRPILIGIAAKVTGAPKPGEVFEGPLQEKIMDILQGRQQAARTGTPEAQTKIVEDGTYAALVRAGLSKGQGGFGAGLEGIGDVFGGDDPISMVFDKLSKPFDQISETIGYTMEEAGAELETAAQAIENSSESFQDWVSEQGGLFGEGGEFGVSSPLGRAGSAAGVAETVGMTPEEMADATQGKGILDKIKSLGGIFEGGLTQLSSAFGGFMASFKGFFQGSFMRWDQIKALLQNPSSGGIGAIAGQAAGGAVVGMGAGSIVDMILGDRGKSGQTEWMSALGGAIGAIWGPLGSMVGGAIGGFVSNFIGGGQKLKQSFIELSVVNGQLAAETVKVIKKYGFFFSSRTRTYREDAPSEFTQALQKQVDATADMLRDLAESLGVATDAIDNFSMEPIKIDTKGKSEEEISAEIEKAMLEILGQQIDDFIYHTDELSGRFTVLVQILKDVNGVTEEFMRGFQIAAALETMMETDIGEEVSARLEPELPMREQILEMQEAAITAAEEFDGSVESLEELTAAYGLAKEAMIQFKVLLIEVGQEISGMFADTAQGIREALMSPEELYAYRDALVDQQVALLAVATDPEEILALSQSINQLVGEMFSTLDEGQREAMGQGFLDFLSGVDNVAQEALGAIQADLGDEWGGFEPDFAGALNEAMGEFYNSQAIGAQAAADQAAAAAQFAYWVGQFGNIVGGLFGGGGAAAAAAMAGNYYANTTPGTRPPTMYGFGNEVNA